MRADFNLAPTVLDVKHSLPRVLSIGAVVFATVPSPYPGSEILVCLVVCVAMMVCISSAPSGAHTRPALPAAFCILCLSSMFWSETPEATLIGSAQLIFLLLAAVVFVRYTNETELLRGVALGFRAALLASVLIAVAVPSIGLMSGSYEGGSLKGIFNHRNLMGFVSILAIVAFWAWRARSPLLRAVDIALAICTLAASQSQSSLVVLLSLIMLRAMVFFVRRTTKLSRVLTVAALVIAVGGSVAGVLYSFEKFTQGIGRDVTLTGRTLIWEVVIAVSERRPLLGYGWNGVWHADSRVANIIWSRIGFSIYHAHNGFIDVQLQLGLAGLLCICLVYFSFIYRSFVTCVSAPSVSRSWPFFIAAALLVANLTESRLGTPIGWLYMSIGYLAVSARTVRKPEDQE